MQLHFLKKLELHALHTIYLPSSRLSRQLKSTWQLHFIAEKSFSGPCQNLRMRTKLLLWRSMFRQQLLFPK
jgi:hypothetical protein